MSRLNQTDGRTGNQVTSNAILANCAVIEEDLALCEYVCTSKIEVQSILRKGINLIMKELG